MTSVPFILTIVLLTMQLTGYISIAWVWVFAPLWIPLVFLFSVVAIVWIVYLTLALVGIAMDGE
jgi:hypothetical protein